MTPDEFCARHARKMRKAAGKPETGHCRGCGQEIIWIRMKSGKAMPCDPELMAVYEGGKKTFVSEEGQILTGTAHKDIGGKLLGHGRVSHFATCPKAGSFRKGGQR